MNNEVEFEGI